MAGLLADAISPSSLLLCYYLISLICRREGDGTVVNLTALDARIAKLQKVRDFLADDEMRELISDPEVMLLLQQAAEARNGHKPMQIVSTDDSVADSAVALPGEGTLRRRVLDIARAMGSRFEARDVIERLKASGFELEASNPMVAVNTALRSLIKKKLVRLARAGSGRVPHMYEARKEQLQFPNK
jgi:hypothetical protein